MLKGITKKSGFAYKILTLMTGTTLAQALTLAISPILTRLYSPEDFGVLATFMAIISVISVVASLRYELAITQPESDDDALAIMMLACVISLSLSALLFLIIFLWGESLLSYMGAQSVIDVMYVIPVTVLVVGLYQALNYWNIRNSRYTLSAMGKFYQNVGVGVGQLAFHGASSFGLVFGYVVGQLSYLLFFLISFLSKDKQSFRLIKKENVIKNIKMLGPFPIYSSAGALADTVSLQMPVFVLNNFFSSGVVGLFSLTFRMLSLPAALISKSVSQVLLQKVSQSLYSSSENLLPLVLKLLLLLVLLFLPFAAVLYFFGSDIFAFVFGEHWRPAGDYATIIVFAIWIRFSVSPLSSIMVLKKNVKKGMYWQFLYLITLTFTLLFFAKSEIQLFLLAFTIHEIILYVIYLLVILTSATRLH